ncbi:GerMN domain-containing protein [uncultured Flavonifractor sp.]|uniref:GerMN domain-containing protein n=1 Tax=uncultured Flavonifractor sp. TaxID=1193534 RepID=UPI002619D5FD|nr:GerMN domain-containing protein [uncultured Flavonifractor sp.]
MKKISILILTGMLLSLMGCTPETGEPSEPGDYRIYYSALEDRYAAMAVGYEAWTLPEGTRPLPGLLKALLRGPSGQELTSPFPDGVRLLNWELLEEGCLHLDLSEQYGSLTGVELTVADACLTLTLCQVPGVESVYVTVEGEEIPYRPIQQLTLADVLLSTGQESPPPAEEHPAETDAFAFG